MNHWLFHLGGCLNAFLLAYFLEKYRAHWYGKHLALIAASGFLMAAAWLMALFQFSSDIPAGSANDGIWWATTQFWVMFGLTITPIVVWDHLFVTQRHTTETDELRAALKEALTQIKELQNGDTT